MTKPRQQSPGLKKQVGGQNAAMLQTAHLLPEMMWQIFDSTAAADWREDDYRASKRPQSKHDRIFLKVG